MSGRRSRRVPVLLLSSAAALAASAALAGCGGSGGHAPGSGGTPAAGPAKRAARTTLPASRLRGALLTKINGIGPAGAAEEGSYASLPAVKAAAAAANGVSVSPRACAPAAWGSGSAALAAGGLGAGGLGAGGLGAALASAPAALVTFRVGANQVSEVLAAQPGSAAEAALGTPVPAGCLHYTATSGGKTYRYTVTQSAVSGIGEQARELNVAADGQPGNDIRSVIYRGGGFVGAVTVIGPDGSANAVRRLAQQAYAYAARTLG